MKYRGREVCSIKVIDKSKNNEVIAQICDKEFKTTNGYEIVIEYVIEEKCEK